MLSSMHFDSLATGFFCSDTDLSFFFLFVLVADLSISSNCSSAVSFELLKLIQKNCPISESQASYCIALT